MKVELIRGRTSMPLATTDVSFRGLFVRTSDPPPLRSLVRLRVVLPAQTIEAHAMVVHVVGPEGDHEAGVGLQFWGFSGAERAAWDEYVRELVAAKRNAVKRGPPAMPVTPDAPFTPTGGPPSGIRAITLEPPSPRAKSK